jgi:uncharacterized protein (TIGR02145 family)/uncharacterized repeat protein (TIGR02543 family)
MKNRILRTAVILAIAATLISIGCGDKGASSEVRGDGNVKALINRMRGTNEPKAPVLYTLNVIKSPETGGSVSKSPDKEQYEKDESVMIIAIPGPDYRFTGWSGASASKDATVTINMDDNKNLTANFLLENVASYTLNVIANPPNYGSVSKSPDKPEYASDESILVTAAPNDGYTFTGWSGASSSTNASVTITMDDSKELIANFAPQTYTLTINSNPPDGGSVSSDPGKSAYTYNEQVTVTATAREGYEFTGWSGASSSTSASVTITMNGNKELTAGFRQTGVAVLPSESYTLTVSASPANGGTVSTNPSKTSYNANDNVAVTAEAAEGYTFVGWADASGSKDKRVTITMNGDKALIAMFEMLTYTLTVSADPSNGGSVSRSPNNANAIYNHGTTVTVTASANTGYKFTGWSGVSTSASANVVVTMDGHKTLTANFEQIPTYTVTFSANSGSGTVSNRNAQEGNSVILPDGSGLSRNGYTFGGWNTNSNGTGTNYNVSTTYTPDGSITLYARWNIVTYAITYTLNSGTVSSSNPASYTVETPAFTLTNPTRTGYTFAGWTGANGTTPQMAVSVPTGSTGDKSYTANWTLIAYTITFNANGGTVSPTSDTTGADGKLASLPTPTRTSYTFNGWYTATTGGTAITMSTVFSANAIVYAQWVSGGVPTPAITTFVDGRDNKRYNKVTIGSQVWMAENLNYDVLDNTSDVCYDNDDANCVTYGRLYSWATAMDINASYNRIYWEGSDVNYRGICPAGWHLPSDVEWDTLVNYVGGWSTAGTKLKSKDGWNRSGNGTDDYGFSALPGGKGYIDGGSFNSAGGNGSWWSATAIYDGVAWSRGMTDDSKIVGKTSDLKANLRSVRCVQDD